MARTIDERIQLYDTIAKLAEQGQTREQIAGKLSLTTEQVRGYCRRMENVLGRPVTVTASKKEDSTLDDAVTQRQEMLKSQFDKRMLNQLLTQKALQDTLLEAIETASAVVPAVEIPVLPAPSDVSSREQTAFLMMSDLHVGAVADREETGGLGEYNYFVFKRRLATLRDKMRSITAHHRKSHPVNNLFIALLGDLIENVEIFPSQSELVDLNLVEQVFACITDLCEFFLGLLDTFEHVYIVSVVGNHGRIGRKGQHKRYINWDYIIARTLAWKLHDYSDRIHFEVPKSSHAIVNFSGWTFLLRHGDGIKSWGGLPHYGIQRSTGRWIAIQAAVGQRFDYHCMGHFHTPANLTFTGGETIINGCFPGTTELSVDVIESLTAPMQYFAMIHPTWGLGARYPILLDKPTRVQ